MPRPRERVGAFGLNTDDLGAPAETAPNNGAAACTSTPADRHDDDVYVGQLVEDLERIRGHTGDQHRLVCRVDVAKAIFLPHLLHSLASLIVVPSELDQVRAKRADG